VAGVIFYHKEHEELQDEYGTQELRKGMLFCTPFDGDGHRSEIENQS
jgi:hypothetical protein